MRVLMWHCDSFRSAVTQRGRSPLVEEPPATEVEATECLLVFAACEKSDEPRATLVAAGAAEEIAKLADQLKVRTIVLHSFAHLFVELSSPNAALKILKAIEADLTARGLAVQRTPFGWFNTLDIRAKGHPISRVAREIRPAADRGA